MATQRTAEAIQLENEVKTHDQAYWVKNKPLVNDDIYDQIVRRLLKIEPDNVYLNKPKAPKVDSQGKVTHSIPMLSLDKEYDFDGILKFCKRVCRSLDEKLKVMFKFDGVSGQLMFDILASRGDGDIGEDITHKLPFMNILTKGDPNFVRGEILFTKSKFKEIKGVVTRKNGEDYKNERNAVGGVLSRDDMEPVQVLTFVDFEYICKEFTHAEIIELGAYGWQGIVEEAKESNFPTDGLVIKVADEEYAKTLGETRHHSKSATAFKFANPGAWSVLRSVLFSPGKHDITPVGKIDPVEITGVSVASPSLHNWKNILDRDLQIGDEIWVERAGDVIPYISASKPGKERTPIEIPPCPVCGGDVAYVDPQLVCVNDDCPGKLLNKLSDAVIRIGIDRLGKPTIQKMIDTHNIENLVDIFSLSMDDLLKMERFGKTSAANLYNEIDKVRQGGAYEWQFLACLNIQGIGRSLSKDLLVDRSISDLAKMTDDMLTKLPNIGDERAHVLIEGIRNNWEYLKILNQIIPLKVAEVKEDINEDAIKICFTGRFPENKKVYYDLLEEKGGYDIMNKVTTLTEVLVVADPSKESNKTKSAKKKGIKIIGIDELFGGVDIGSA